MSYATRTDGPYNAPNYFFSDTVGASPYWRLQHPGFIYQWHEDGFSADGVRYQTDPTTIQREIWIR